MRLTHGMLHTASRGGAVLCTKVLVALRRELPQESFTAAEAVAALEAVVAREAEVEWTDAARGYHALVMAGFLPDTGVVWRMAGLAFRGLPAPLSAFAETLGLENWEEARAATAAYFAAHYAVAVAGASRTAYYYSADDSRAAYYAGVAADAAAYYDAAVRDEILEIIIAEIDAAPEPGTQAASSGREN